MVFSTPRRVRGRIDFIWDNLIIPATGIKDDRHLSDDVLQRFQIQQVTQFNFENLDSIPISISQTPPILIQPMPLGELQSLVVDEFSLSDLRPFRDFDSSKAGQYGWEVDSCTESIRNNVEDWATSPSMRPIPFSADGFGLVFPTRRGLSPIAHPKPFLLGGELAGPDFHPSPILESDGDPLVIISASHDHNGMENSILFGELALLVRAMRNRAHQPKVENEDQLEELEMMSEKEREKQCGLQFPKETAFPVLLLSFVGPQHGRMFYASMYGQEMVIRQSKLYSFETKANAPLDLFARILLSRPL